MSTFRSLNRWRWWVMAWFFACLGTAVAAPLVQPRTLEVVCSGAGSALVVHAPGGEAPAGPLGLDCALCLLGSAPPLPAQARLPALPVSTPLPAAPPGVHAVAPMATPPPARAPPFSLCQS